MPRRRPRKPTSRAGTEPTLPEAEQTFARLMAELDYPMLIVTVRAGGEPDGCLVGFSTQCSIDPPRFLVCLSEKNRTFRAARQAEALAVHVIGPEAKDLAELFGSLTQDEIDKFSRCSWHPGPHELPILDDCPRWFAGRILERRALGDHVGFVLEPFASALDGPDGQLGFQAVRELEPGHEA